MKKFKWSKTEYKLKSIIKAILTPIIDNFIYTIKYAGMKVKLKGGFEFLRKWNFLDKEEKYFLDFNLTDKIIYDIGSHIGILTIFFAKSAKFVVAFEPNPETFIKLIKNVHLNSIENVKILNLGIGNKKDKSIIVMRKYNPGSGSMDKEIQNKITSETGTKNVEVNIDTLDNCFKEYNLPKPDFIKIDIEGLEYDALIGMNEIIKNWKPSLYIEIHGADYQCKLTNINRIVNYLYKRSYNIYHIESGKVISRKNVSAALEGHIYCTSK